MSHVIPQHVFQTLKSSRCNSNVFRAYQKLTKINYVRVFGEERLPPAGAGPTSAHHTPAARRARTPTACPRDRRTPAWFPKNVARNSPNHPSNFEIRSLQFQRFQGISKTDQDKLRATFGVEYAPANARQLSPHIQGSPRIQGPPRTRRPPLRQSRYAHGSNLAWRTHTPQRR